MSSAGVNKAASLGQGKFKNLFLVMKPTALKEVQIFTFYLLLILCDRDLCAPGPQMFSDHITS